MFWKSKLNKQQKEKLKSLKETLKEIEREAEKMMEQEDRVLGLDNLEIVLGVAQLKYEEKFRKAMNNFIVTGELPQGPIGDAIKNQALLLEKQQTALFPPMPTKNGIKLDLASAEKEFDNETDGSNNFSKKVLH